ncbi:MAG: hypothetical protein GXP45_04350 [bacterium]|nr:hypothetical protein [bacterium]
MKIAGLKELNDIPIDDWSLSSLKEIDLFESNVEKLLHDDKFNQHQRNIASAQMDLASHLDYINHRAKMYYRKT